MTDPTMTDGNVLWSVSVARAQFAGCLLSTNDDRFPSVELDQEGETLKLLVTTRGVYSISEALEESRELVEQVLDTAAVTFCAVADQPRHVSHQLPQPPGTIPPQRLTVGVSVSSAWNIQPAERVISAEEARLHLQPRFSKRIPVLTAFRLALGQTDPVSRFMLLYNCLLQCHSDSQKRVDEAILKRVPDCSVSPSPKDGKPETVYTRLRNEVGHARADLDFSRTISEVRSNISRFETVTASIVANAAWSE